LIPAAVVNVQPELAGSSDVRSYITRPA
jgi:hypothetical protein